MAHLFPEHDMRSDNRRPNQPPRLPPNPTRVDRLVGEMQKEHPKVSRRAQQITILIRALHYPKIWIGVKILFSELKADLL